MKIDAGMELELDDAKANAERLEALGYDGIKARYGDLVDRVTLEFPDLAAAKVPALIERLKAA